jgi:pyridoxamine 5'-phosphate oxidase
MTDHPLAGIRTEYGLAGLDEGEMADDPLTQLSRWLDQAMAADAAEPTAMVLATVSADGRPSARTVLCKGVDEGGVVFFTNHSSRKGRELAANPACAAVFRWDALQRQVILRGVAGTLPGAGSDAYFASRPRPSQIAAWASRQSEVIEDRSVLERRVADLERRFAGGPVPRPPFWGGYRIVPEDVELWQGRPSRLHDRLRYRRREEGWRIERLSP